MNSPLNKMTATTVLARALGGAVNLKNKRFWYFGLQKAIGKSRNTETSS